MDMIQRLSQFIEKMHISIRSFEQAIGASNGMIRKAIANNTDIQSKWVTAIVENFPQLDIRWLLTGEGEMLRTETLPIIEGLADRLSEIIIDIDSELSSIAASFGLTAEELANFTNNFEWPQCPFDFVEFLKEYPEYSYQWILTGLGPKFNGDEEQCLKAVKRRAYENAHPEFYPNKAHQDVKQDSNDQLWKQIAFQNEQLKDRDEQIKQLLNILQEKTH